MSDNIPTRQVNRVSVENSFNDYVQEIEKKDATDELVSFVEEQIQKMQKYSHLGNGMPGFYELNEALLDFNRIQTGLIGLDVAAKLELDEATEAFKNFQAEKYIEARNVLNPTTLTASKWYSSSEIEAYIRVHYREEYNNLHKKMICAETKVAAIRRLLDAWSTQSLTLNRLCKNVEVEALQLGGGLVNN